MAQAMSILIDSNIPDDIECWSSGPKATSGDGTCSTSAFYSFKIITNVSYLMLLSTIACGVDLVYQIL